MSKTMDESDVVGGVGVDAGGKSSEEPKNDDKTTTRMLTAGDGQDMEVEPTTDDSIGKAFLEQWNKRVEERRAIRESNLDVCREDFEKLVKGKKLDSNLKKCTAFVRKVKQFIESQRHVLLPELNTLNLTKYQSEIAFAIVDAKYTKHEEFPPVIKICSELHQRYVDFAKHLIERFTLLLDPQTLESEELTPAFTAKLSSDVRLLAELMLEGILPQQEAYQLLLQTIQTMSLLDKDGSHFVVPFVFLCKGLVDDLFGLFTKSNEALLKKSEISLSELRRSHVLTDDQKEELRTVIVEYFNQTVCGAILKRHKKWIKFEKNNRKLLKTKGEIPEDRIFQREEINAKIEKYNNNASKLASLLDLQMPVLQELPPDSEDELEKALLVTENGEVLTEVPGIVLFNDEETRQFYQDYPDLKVYLPAVVYRECMVQMQEKTKKMQEMERMMDQFDEAKEQAELQEEKEGDDGETQDIVGELDGDLLPSMRPETRTEEDENEPVEGKDSAIVIQPQRQSFNSYLQTLQNCVNKEMIDRAAGEFAECFNNKRRRRELVRHLFLVARKRVDLLPLFSRLIAILSKVFPDIGIEITTMLIKDFRFLVLKKDQMRIDSKLRITRFISELVKFSIFPKAELFNSLKMLLRNFVHHQVEMTCALLESCGRFLYRSTDSHRRMKIYLDVMQRKKAAGRFDKRYTYMIDTAYYHTCAPPGSDTASQKKQKQIRLPLHAYMEYVLWEDLNKNTLERAHRVLRKYDWTDPTKHLLVIKIFTAPWKFSYVQMESAAALLATVKRFKPSVTQDVVEDLVEQVRLGCDFEFDDCNSFRISTCQFLAYMYTYKAFSTSLLFSLWYYLISYGATYQQDVFTRMDPPTSLHRIRMICHMLRICGDYLSSHGSNRRLNYFLKYFQRYYVYKRSLKCWKTDEFPYAVEEHYVETFRRVRSDWKLATTMQQAEQDIIELDQSLRQNVTSQDVKSAMSNPTNCVKLSSVSPFNINIINKAKTRANYQNKDANGNYKTNASPRLATVTEDDDFIDEFEKMYWEENQSGTTPRVGRIELPMPAGNPKDTDSPAKDGTVKVTLLTKKNNKPKVKTVQVSAQEDFVVNIKSREEEEKLEKQEMKSRTLAMTRMQQEEERRANMQSLSSLLFSSFSKKQSSK